MTKNRKILKIFVSIVIALAVAAAGFFGYVLYRFNCDKSGSDISYEQIYNSDSVSLDIAQNGIFKVVKINDTHLFNGICDNDVKTLEGIENVLNNNAFDLIIVDGDLVEGFNLSPDYDKYNAINAFAKIIDSYDVAWTFVPGNNDGEIDGDNEDVIRYLMQYNNFIYGNSKAADGSMQLFIDLKTDEKTVHSIAVLDSHSRKIKAIGPYDYIKQNQIDWLKNGINERKVSTSVFYHMPTTDFRDAFYNGEPYDGIVRYDNNDYGQIKENALFADAFKDNEYIKLISCAHQHGNNMCAYYNDRYYQLSSISGYGAGKPEGIVPLCTLTTIDVNADDAKSMYEFEQITLE